jgi:dihydroorotase
MSDEIRPVIRGGEIVDPGSGLRGQMDIAISGGKIAEVGPSLREADARKTISAKDRPVIPGLVDVHAHIFVNCSDMGEPTDRLCNSSGVTTVCDAGSAGSANFAGLRFVVDKAVRTRTRAFVNLSAIGIVGTARSGELAHFPYADPEGCAQTIAENRDIAIGVKLRYGPGIVWEYTTEPVKAARRAADMAGVPMMVHITDSPLPLPEMLAHMKPRATSSPTACTAAATAHHDREDSRGRWSAKSQKLLRTVNPARCQRVIEDAHLGK